MTHKYMQVRREMYERDPASKAKLNRSFKDMVRLFRFFAWFLLGVIVVSEAAMLKFLFTGSTSPYIFVPMVLIWVCPAGITIPREKYLYHASARTAELAELQQRYQLYTAEAWDILTECGIDSAEKLLSLKRECKAAIDEHAEKYNRMGRKIFDMLVGVPLGALISSVIHVGGAVNIEMIVTVMSIGVTVGFLIKAARFFRNYTDGFFKDEYLMSVLNELDYIPRTRAE